MTPISPITNKCIAVEFALDILHHRIVKSVKAINNIAILPLCRGLSLRRKRLIAPRFWVNFDKSTIGLGKTDEIC